MSNFTTTNHMNNNGLNIGRRPLAIIALLIITATLAWLTFSADFNNTITVDPGSTGVVEGGALSTQKTLWTNQAVANYSYDLQVMCFCFPDVTRPVTVVVNDGEVVSITYIDDGSAADPDLFTSYSTVESLFERLENAQAQEPATFNVTYDAQYGVPQVVSIDIDERMADEEINFTVSNFEVMP